jgi:hypothetical protein
MNMNINEIILGLDKVADTIAAQEIPGNKDAAVKFFRQAAYALRTTFARARVWYSPVECTDTIASAGTSVSHLWDSIEEFFDEADWVDYGDIIKMNRSLDISPVFSVLLPTARNEDGTVLQSEVHTFSTLQEAVMARDEAMKEQDQ